MVQLQKKNVKIVSILIALTFVVSIVAVALTAQTGSGIASAASSNVGVVDFQQVAMKDSRIQAFDQEVKDAEAEFKSKAASMSEQEQRDYYQQTQQRLAQRQQEIGDQVKESVDKAVKEAADNRGLSVVLDKAAVIYGGTDITQDVLKKMQ